MTRDSTTSPERETLIKILRNRIRTHSPADDIEASVTNAEEVADLILAVLRRATTIPPDSRSYPYLALAQWRDIDYGHVLSYADVLSSSSVQPETEPQRAAMRTLSDDDKLTVAKVYLWINPPRIRLD